MIFSSCPVCMGWFNLKHVMEIGEHRELLCELCAGWACGILLVCGFDGTWRMMWSAK